MLKKFNRQKLLEGLTREKEKKLKKKEEEEEEEEDDDDDDDDDDDKQQEKVEEETHFSSGLLQCGTHPTPCKFYFCLLAIRRFSACARLLSTSLAR